MFPTDTFNIMGILQTEVANSNSVSNNSEVFHLYKSAVKIISSSHLHGEQVFRSGSKISQLVLLTFQFIYYITKVHKWAHC
jgi:hypothetical protein